MGVGGIRVVVRATFESSGVVGCGVGVVKGELRVREVIEPEEVVCDYKALVEVSSEVIRRVRKDVYSRTA